MKRLAVGLLWVVFVLPSCVFAGQDSKADLYLRKGPEITPVKRVTDKYPLSDQGNKGGWVPYKVMTDEFEGEVLDESRWWPVNPKWKGRQPAAFAASNVTVSDDNATPGDPSSRPSPRTSQPRPTTASRPCTCCSASPPSRTPSCWVS